MIILKSDEEIRLMRDAGRIAALARQIGGEHCKVGVTTAQIDAVIRKTIQSHGATPSFLGLYGFPGSACISVNEEVIHGIPSDRVLKNGDIVKEANRIIAEYRTGKKRKRLPFSLPSFFLGFGTASAISIFLFILLL